MSHASRRVGAACLACVAALACAAPPAVSASAYAPSPGFLPGTAVTAAYPDGEFPLEAERELITFKITGYPAVHMTSGYGSKATARYVFRNPTGEDVSATMLFPFGGLPEYASADEQTFDDSALVSVTSGEGEEPADYVVRASYDEYAGSMYGFDFSVRRKNLSEEPSEDESFSLGLPVAVYHIRERRDGGHTAVTFSCPGEGRVFARERYGGSFDRGTGTAVFDGEGDIYFLGGAPDNVAFFARTCDGGASSDVYCGEPADTAIPAPEPEIVSFAEFMELCRPACLAGVSQSDWFNLFTGHLRAHGTYLADIEPLGRDIAVYSAMRWLQYEITVPAGGTAINSVTVPVYPDIILSTEPYSYGYTYLAPSSCGMKGLGSPEVRIECEDNVVYSSTGGFCKEEYGYSFGTVGLPNGELYFELCSDPEPEETDGGAVLVFSLFFLALAASFVMPFVILSLAGVPIVVAVIKKDEKKFNERRASAKGSGDAPPAGLPSAREDEGRGGDGS